MPVDAVTLSIFLSTVMGFILTPGPNMVFCVSRAIASGPTAGIQSALGVCLGLTVHAAAAGTGLSGLFRYNPLAYDLLRVCGAGYLLWLAWQAIRDDGRVSLNLPGAESSQPHRGWRGFARYFTQGCLNALLSPKSVMFYIVLFPQFLDPGRGDILVQSLFLVSVINVINFSVIAGLCLFAGGAKRWFRSHPRFLIWQRRFVAAVFLSLAVRVFLDRPSTAAE